MENKINYINELLASLPAAVERAAGLCQALAVEIEALTVAGCADATPSYRDGKYLYMIYPTQEGKRRRVYVGANPDNIREALESLERFKKRAELKSRLASLEQHIWRATSDLHDAVLQLERVVGKK